MAEQERTIRGVAMVKGAQGFDVVIFADPGVSGAIALSKRPAGAEMLEAAKRGDTIVAAKLDRIFRSASDALVTVEKLSERGVSLILADMSLDPITSNGTGKLFFSMLCAFAEFERHRIAERITDGKRAKKANGGHLGGHAPYGYARVGSGKASRLEPIEAEQAVIRQIVGASDKQKPYHIMQDLAAQGVVNRAGKPFRVMHVQRFIERASVNG